MFWGRSFELDTLNKSYMEDGFQLCIIYGRRKVGKTALLEEFYKGKPAIFFTCEDHSEVNLLREFNRCINDYFKLSSTQTFNSWEDAFSFLSLHSTSKRIILVIDNFYRMISINKSLSSFLMDIIEKYLKQTQIYLILSGSPEKLMEREILSCTNYLYKLNGTVLKLHPFDFYESVQPFNNYSMVDKVRVYGILGGIPQYLQKFDPKLSLEFNIIENLLNSSSDLFKEADNFIKSNINNSKFCNYILSSISRGNSNISKLCLTNPQTNSNCKYLINTLIELDVISEESYLGNPLNIKHSYTIKDNLFKFWYRFIFSNIFLIERGLSNYVYEHKIKSEINSYLGYVFEEICMEFLIRKNKKFQLPFVFESMGNWWQTTNEDRRTIEIDILASSKDSALLGECKWTKDPMSMKVINALLNKSKYLNFKNKYYAFFSKSGFTDEVKLYASGNPHIYIYDLLDISFI